MRAKIGLVEGQIARLNAVIEALLPLVPEARRGRYQNRLPAPSRSFRGGTAFEAVVAMLNQLPAREWTAPDLYDRLVSAGSPVEIEQIHNVLAYLVRKGRLIRTARGKYVPPGMARAMERLDEFAS